MIRLMMACNDMQIANETLGIWGAEQPNAKKTRQNGAKLYFVRLQFSHLYEAMDIVESILRDSVLFDLLQTCDSETRSSFSYVCDYLNKPRGAKRDWLNQYVGRMRSSLVFHYDETGKQIREAVRAINEKGTYLGEVTRATHAHNWYFEPSDQVVDRIVIRQIWQIPQSADAINEANKIVDQVHELFLKFMDFAGELIWKYTSRY